VKPADVLRLRLENQGLARRAFRDPADAVRWHGAVQAQDYLGALWALGIRTRSATETSVEAAEERRAIVRTWPLRGTLHFVAADDARWITQLLAPRIIARHAARWKRDFGIEARLLGRAGDILSRALEGGRRLTREALYEILESQRIRTGESRGLHLLLVLALQGRLCLAGRLGKQQSFALLDEWIPTSRRLEGDGALTELARRYFTSHGPATGRDFMWWAGVTARQAEVALDGMRGELARVVVDDQVFWWSGPERPARARRAAPNAWLLPAYDEYTVAYRDRTMLAGTGSRVTKMGLLAPVVVVDGQVVGTWKRVLDRDSVRITTSLSRKLTTAEAASLLDAARSYGEYLGLEAHVAGLGGRRH
jgi:hypothetical protein